LGIVLIDRRQRSWASEGEGGEDAISRKKRPAEELGKGGEEGQISKGELCRRMSIREEKKSDHGPSVDGGGMGTEKSNKSKFLGH